MKVGGLDLSEFSNADLAFAIDVGLAVQGKRIEHGFVKVLQQIASRLKNMPESPKNQLADLLSRTYDERIGRVHTAAVKAIIEERQRQCNDEGFDTSHDDEHDPGDLLTAAILYLLSARESLLGFNTEHARTLPHMTKTYNLPWPLGERWWKPRDAKCDIERAGALVLAELERILRAQSDVDDFTRMDRS